MTAPTPTDIEHNPADPSQYVVLWGNGRIDSYGGVPPIEITGNDILWFDRPDQPIGMAIHITNWATGDGYVLDMQGGFQHLNAAPALGIGQGGAVVTDTLGIPYTGGLERYYADWAWDPGGATRGAVLTIWGEVKPFGGLAAPPRLGNRWNLPLGRKLQMRFTPDIRAVTMDSWGGLNPDYAAAATGTPNVDYDYYFERDAARDFVITDWATSSGYSLDMTGVVHRIKNTTDPFGYPYKTGTDVARLLDLVSASNPLTFREVWSGGQVFLFNSSTAPTVLAGGTAVSPPATVTTTTRPTLSWDYSDPQHDSQAEYEVALFTQAYVDGHTMTDPWSQIAGAIQTWDGFVSTIRGVVPDVDLANATYRFYVRVKDTSGLWSAWGNRGWTQNVAVPATPGAMTATPDAANAKVALSCTTPAGAGSLVRFECSDDGGATWAPVRGAEAVTRIATTLGTDLDPPFGASRGYRAVRYDISPRTASAPSAAVYTSIVTKLIYTLRAVSDAALGGEVMVIAAPTWGRDADAGVFLGVGAKYPVVVDDGVLKARKQTLTVETNSAAAFAALDKLVTSRSVLIYRDPFGMVVYCKIVGTVNVTQQRRLPYVDEITPLGHQHNWEIPLVQIAQPGT